MIHVLSEYDNEVDPLVRVIPHHTCQDFIDNLSVLDMFDVILTSQNGKVCNFQLPYIHSYFQITFKQVKLFSNFWPHLI